MSPSSLIFLLIVAIWAAYLLQHWVRRREHLATARSVDRFSEAMRVLERRESLQTTAGEASQHRSYAVSPTRAIHSTAVVKPARVEDDARPSVSERPHRSDRSGARDGHAPRQERRGLLSRLAGVFAGVTARRVRGISLVLAVLALVTLAVLVPVLALPWWAVAVAGGVVVVDLAWLRLAARRTTPSRQRRPASRSDAPSAAHSADLGTSPRISGLSEPSRGSRVRRPVPEAVLYDEVLAHVPATGQAGEGEGEGVELDVAPRVNAAPAPADPHGWQPVPVPPPTYTLKAKAQRPAPVPTQTVDAPHLDDEVYDEQLANPAAAEGPAAVDYSGVPTRDLPFDGYALDEELEDLPPVYQAV